MKNFIIILLNKLGLGVNTYVPSPRILVNSFKKVFGDDVDVRISRESTDIFELEFNYGNETLYISYTINNTRVKNIEIF